MFGTFNRFALVCFAACAYASAAAAQAPIEYANNRAEAPVQMASADDRLTGGADNSYGYGAQQRSGQATIDIRRTTGRPRVVEVSAPAPERAALPETPASNERPQWLEQERVGPPYQAEGRWFVPTAEPGYEQTGVASWYGADFQGQATASGEAFDQDALTAAHPTLPIPSLVQVTNLENGREVIVRVNDRGPFTGDRVLDVSRAAANALGFTDNGHARVHVRYLGPAPRRVSADGSPAPAANHVPAAPAQQTAERGEGPTSLLPPPAANDGDLDGAPMQATAPQPAPRYAATTGAYVVQVGAFSDPGNAQRVRDAVSTAGPVSVDVRNTSRGELFRVRVGPWPSREDADAALQTVAALGFSDAVVAAR